MWAPELVHEEVLCNWWLTSQGDMALEPFQVDEHTWTLHLSYKGDDVGDFYQDDMPTCPDCGSWLLIDNGFQRISPWDWFLPHSLVSG